jgi:hypothetical protein
MYELEVEESTVGSSAATMMAAAVYFADMEEYRKVWHSARSQAARAARKHGDGPEGAPDCGEMSLEELTE